MSHWNFRLTVRTLDGPDGPEEYWGIRELYYDDAGTVTSWTEDTVSPEGESRSEVCDELARFVENAVLPAFDLDTLSWREVRP